MRWTLAIILGAIVGSGCASTTHEFATPLSQTYVAPAPVGPAGEPQRPEPLVDPPRFDLPYALILDPARPLDGPRSVGTASNGRIVDAVRLPLDGELLFVLPSHRPRHAYFATRELAQTLLAAASRVDAAYPGSRLAMGDASLAAGGDIAGHASHEAGRDIDLPFYMQTQDGERVETPAFVRFNRNLRGAGFLFDVERNWLLVKGLIEESGGTLEWLFVSRPIARALVDHARQIGEPEAVIEYAEAVLWEPSDSSPHADHFHVRLFCTVRDRLEGCVNYGPEWEFAVHGREAHQARVDELLRALHDPDHQRRVAAIDFLLRIAARSAGEPLAEALPDQPPAVQLEILAALRAFRPRGVGRQLASLIATTDDDVVRAAAMETVAAYTARGPVRELVALLPADPSSPELRRGVARAYVLVGDYWRRVEE